MKRYRAELLLTPKEPRSGALNKFEQSAGKEHLNSHHGCSVTCASNRSNLKHKYIYLHACIYPVYRYVYIYISYTVTVYKVHLGHYQGIRVFQWVTVVLGKRFSWPSLVNDEQ